MLEQASMRNPHDMPLLGAYGRALADAGDYNQALSVLGRAHTPDNPDWRILNAQGAVLDQLGRHAEAQRHYSAALKIVPDEPSILSNLGLSYALTKDLQTCRGDVAAGDRAAEREPEGTAESGAGGRLAGALRRSRENRRGRLCHRMRPPPMSTICAQCWRSRATGKSPVSDAPRRSTPAPDKKFPSLLTESCATGLAPPLAIEWP